VHKTVRKPEVQALD